MPIRVTNHSCVRRQQFGDMEQIRSVLERLDNWDTAVDSKQRLVVMVGEGGKADGFQVLRIGHLDSPPIGWEVVNDLFSRRTSSVHEYNSHIKLRATTFVIRRMGGSYARADKPEIQEPGRPEGLPRTAAIARKCRHKKAPQS